MCFILSQTTALEQGRQLISGKNTHKYNTSDITWLVRPSHPQHTHTEHFSKMPVGFPSIQFKSDTMYLELSSDSHKLKTQSHKTVLTSDADPKSQVVSYISDILTINWILYDLLHGSSNLLEWFIQFRETLLPEYYQRYNKRHKWTARQSNT